MDAPGDIVISVVPLLPLAGHRIDRFLQPCIGAKEAIFEVGDAGGGRCDAIICLLCGHELGGENGIIRRKRNAPHSGIHPGEQHIDTRILGELIIVKQAGSGIIKIVPCILPAVDSLAGVPQGLAGSENGRPFLDKFAYKGAVFN
jgi:hypothetical protein